jgi:hypothetical protein
MGCLMALHHDLQAVVLERDRDDTVVQYLGDQVKQTRCFRLICVGATSQR